MWATVFAATIGVAIGDPMTWITSADYPRISLQEEHDGLVSIEFLYDPSGHVFECDVVASSGWPELDQRTCDAILARAHIKPSRDNAGQAVGTKGQLRFNWVLPNKGPKPHAPLSPDIEIEVASLPADTKRPSLQVVSIVAENGSVESCAINGKRGTGSEGLDRAACKTVMSDMFPTARDSSGKPMRYLRIDNVAFVVRGRAADLPHP